MRSGDRIGADARVIEHLQVDESILTGETEPVDKFPDILTHSHSEKEPKSKLLANVQTDENNAKVVKIPIGERKNMIFRHSLVTSNTGLAVVTATGFNTKMGQLNKKLQSSVSESTDFEKRVNKFLYVIFGIALLLVFIIIAINRFKINGPILLYASASAVAILPESILLVVTLISAIAMKSLSNQNAIVRKLNVLSTIGTVTWICSDKTGTLTTNSMQVQRIYPWNPTNKQNQSNLIAVGGGVLTDDQLFYNIPDGFKPLPNNETPHESTYINNHISMDTMNQNCYHLSMVSAMCNQSRLQYDSDVIIDVEKDNKNGSKSVGNGKKLKGTGGNATELSLAVLSYKLGQPLEKYENDGWYRCGMHPFDSKVKSMSVGVRRPISLKNKQTGEVTESYEAYVLTKGAPEIVIQKCSNLTPAEKVRVLEHVDHLASQSYRVLALAVKNVSCQKFHHADENIYHIHYNEKTQKIDILPPETDTFVLDNVDGHRLQDIDRVVVESNLNFVGFVAIEDPIKESSFEVVRTCKEAGISFTMLTGDNPKIAAAISRRLGILEPFHSTDDYLITGPIFDSLSDEQIDQLPVLPVVIARCSPESKLTYVRALQRRKQVVVGIGDDLNDALQLNEADVGGMFSLVALFVLCPFLIVVVMF